LICELWVMTDVHSQVTRSYNMSRVRSKNTKPELVVRKFLHGQGFRYRLHVSSLPGKPDMVLPKYKTVIFIHGCFWHGHKGCRYFVIPKTRTEWWLQKIKGNQKNDQLSTIQLQVLGWKVISVWECELKKGMKEETLHNLITSISK
jgi:DNA mismatch endonuclease (patch repair protein)